MPTSTIAAPTLLEALPDVVVVANSTGRIVYVNSAVRTLLGRDPGEVQGQPLTVLIPERFRAAHTHGFDRFLATGVGKLVGATTQVPVLHADGSLGEPDPWQGDLLLGVDGLTARHEHVVALRPGATVLMFTDGLVERRHEDLDTGLAIDVDQGACVVFLLDGDIGVVERTADQALEGADGVLQV